MGNFATKFHRKSMLRGKLLLLPVLLLLPAARTQETFPGSEDIQQALEKAQTLGSVLMIAAHPDDENTAVLAWLARGRHVRTGYLSLTRGEGGQNLLGPEQGDALGVLRTQELLDARRIDGAQQFFTRAVDFGFSKSPKEAISKWGHDEILSDIVWVIRRFQPDVVILRFSGTPRDGHGHHQASAILGKEAYEVAGDPTRFPEQLQYVKPWHAKRLVWNAFAFTPEQEKETEKLGSKIKVDTGAFNPVLGRSYAEIAAISSSQHRSQGMGVGLHHGPQTDYFVPVEGDAASKDLFDGVDISWNRLEGGRAVGEALGQALSAYDSEHPERILPQLVQARELARKLTPSERVNEKIVEIDHLLALCSGLWVDAVADKYSVVPGGSLKVTLTAVKRCTSHVTWKNAVVQGLGEDHHQEVNAELGADEPVTKDIQVAVPASEPYSQAFWLTEPRHGDRYVVTDQKLIGRPDPVPVLTADMDLEIAGTRVMLHQPVIFRYVDHVRGELTRPVEVVPPVEVDLPERDVMFPNGEGQRIVVQVRALSAPVSASIHLHVPAGWTVESPATDVHFDALDELREISFQVKPPAGQADGKAEFRAAAVIDSKDISTGLQNIVYDHIPPQVIFLPAEGALRPLSLRVLVHNVGYVMGAGDDVPEAIRQMGCTVTLLSKTDLLDGDLSRFEAIVTGVRADNTRPDLRAAKPRLLEYVRNGGTLIVQYNVPEYARFGDNSEKPGELCPYPMQISRDRVTDEDSPVSLIDPSSPLLSSPNPITKADFDGWVQERGLYYASKWDAHYSTVIATHDPGEEFKPGGMLFTRYGKGAYVFTAYSWFRQLPAGVPGAYRIFANLLSAGKTEK
jgi:LmbE family N-acetylglucosaminyl deacetylase